MGVEEEYDFSYDMGPLCSQTRKELEKVSILVAGKGIHICFSPLPHL